MPTFGLEFDAYRLSYRRETSPETLPEPPETNDDESQTVIPFRPVVREGVEDLSGFRRVSHEEAVESSLDSTDSDDEPELVGESVAANDSNQVNGKRIALIGRFGSMNRREAANVLQSYHATVVENPRVANRRSGGNSLEDEDSEQDRDEACPPASANVDWVVIGAEQPPLSQSELLHASLIDAAGRGEIEILHETELWQRIGLVDAEVSVHRYHTPAMLADLLNVSVRVIRRWHRRGLITPVVTVHRLPYFDFAEVSTAKRLAGWIADGTSPETIERRLVELVEVLPNIRRPLDQLSILVEGKHILLRQGDGLIEPGGQMRFNFEALDATTGVEGGVDAESIDDSRQSPRNIVAFEIPDQPPMLRAKFGSSGMEEDDPLLAAAYDAEDADDLETAVELYHTVLARDGARADISFQIAELLYRMNFLVGARERYYNTIELDPDFVEARASLGAVLSELGQYELAIAALHGALKMYEDYADVHYTLAKTLDRVDRDIEAEIHWHRCLKLSPESPWADEVKHRLGL